MISSASGLRFAPAAVAALLVVSFSGVGDHDLWTPDEPRVAAVGREVSLGAWVVPTLGGEPFLEEPPLHAWCTGAFYRAFGVDPPWRARWISVFFGLGTLAAAGWLAVEAGGRRAALPAALVLGLCGEHVMTAHRVVVDGALAFFTTLSVCALLRGLRMTSPSRAWLWLILAYAASSLAFLAKGPIGLAAPALALAAWAVATRDRRVLLRARLWLAPPVFLALAGPWLLALWWEAGLDGLRVVLVDNFLGRVLSSDVPRSHVRPFYYYLYLLPVHLMPATLFLAAGAMRRWSRRASLPPAERAACDFGLLWLGLGLLMLSASSTKRVTYMLPFLPGAALAGGLWVAAFIDGSAKSQADRLVMPALGSLLLACGASLPLLAAFLPDVPLAWAVTGALITAGAAALGHVAHRKGSTESSLAWILAGIGLLVIFACKTAMPPLDRIKSLGSVSQKVAALVPQDRDICAFEPDETTVGMLPLYTGRKLRVFSSRESLSGELQVRGEVYLLVVEKRGRKSEALADLGGRPQETLLEDVRERSRTFKLVRVGR